MLLGYVEVVSEICRQHRPACILKADSKDESPHKQLAKPLASSLVLSPLITRGLGHAFLSMVSKRRL